MPRRLLAASLRGDYAGTELTEGLERAQECAPHGLLLDAPPGQASARARARLRGGGRRARAGGAVASELGEAVAQREV